MAFVESQLSLADVSGLVVAEEAVESSSQENVFLVSEIFDERNSHAAEEWLLDALVFHISTAKSQLDAFILHFCQFKSFEFFFVAVDRHEKSITIFALDRNSDVLFRDDSNGNGEGFFFLVRFDEKVCLVAVWCDAELDKSLAIWIVSAKKDGVSEIVAS